MMMHALDVRVLFAAKPVFNFAELTQFVIPEFGEGISLGFDTHYVLKSSVAGSGKGDHRVSVRTEVNSLGEGGTDLHATVDGVQDLVLTLASTGGGTALKSLGFFYGPDSSTFASDSIGVQGLQLAPASMVLGKKYTGRGIFNGGEDSDTITGPITATTQLQSMQKVDVPDGVFNAVKGVCTLVLAGKKTESANGKTVVGKFSLSISITFWADPTEGLVKFKSAISTSISAKGFKTKSASVTLDAIRDTDNIVGLPQVMADYAAPAAGGPSVGTVALFEDGSSRNVLGA